MNKPKEKRNALLWQAFGNWDRIMQQIKRSKQRIAAIERGDSNLDPDYERKVINDLTPLLEQAKEDMVAYGENVGPVWDWMTGLRGIGEHTAAKILALYDYPSYETVSKFWRDGGWAVIDGEIERPTKGEKNHYNARLKSEIYLAGVQFVMRGTEPYNSIYREEKVRQKEMHPIAVCKECGGVGEKRKQRWYCRECNASGFKIAFTPKHLDLRARRKMVKIFLEHLWVVWRTTESLPVTEPYAQAILGHSHYVKPPRVEGVEIPGVDWGPLSE